MATGNTNFLENVIEILDFGDDFSSPRVVEIDLNEKGAIRKYLNGIDGDDKDETMQDVFNINHTPAEELKLRQYQIELTVWALKGHNTIICAPTGSGKTIVAVNIIAEHLRKGKLANQKPKVAFLVPTVNLVDQQSEVLNRYLRNEFKIFGIKGGQTGINTRKASKGMMVQRNDVSVMTPQLLLNMLTAVPSENGDELATKITDFSLIVFDECHHSDKSHAYNEIMIGYFAIKFDKNRPTDDEKLPQIVGLTASLGVGQADNLESARDHIIKICANLDAERLSVVERYRDELEQFVYSPKDEVVLIRCAHNTHPFSRNLINMMEYIEKMLDPIFRHLDEMKIKSNIGIVAPERRWSAIYNNWAYAWYHFAPTLENADIKRKLTTLMEHLIVYHNALEINAHVPTKFAFEYLKEEFEIIIRKKTTELDENLIALFNSKENTLNMIAESPEIINPIVSELKKILLREYNEKNDSRTLIFVRTRELAKAVERYLNFEEALKFLKAGRLTGVNASKDVGGQTEREQQEFLQRFKKGEHKVVVATTVAEEGLDIEKCNVVIKYNDVTNEIALMQRRGRGRAEGSKSILLTHEGWIEKKEMINMIREKLMKRAIEFIRSRGDNWLSEEVKRREIQFYKDRLIEKRQREQTRKRLGNKLFDIKCKKCDHHMTDSSKVRRVQDSYYVSVDPNIWESLCAEPDDAPKLFENLSVAGKVSCISCRNDCGIVIKYRQVYLPALKIDSLVISNRENREKKCSKKWKQVIEQYFVVDPLAHAELLPMYHVLKDEIRIKLDKALEDAEAAELAVSSAIEPEVDLISF